MKLLGAFKEQLKTLGELRYVWLTSFNINIEFIETYLLPAVLDMEQPKNRLDYEHFQLALTEKKIDFRVFCDKRFMEADKNKRTAISVHGVSPAQWAWLSKESLFHPKVVYLEDVNGKKILGAGSANLTIDGWGRNQEVFRFNEIRTSEQYRSVKLFFDEIASNVGITEKLPEPTGLPREDSQWSFVHSFQETTFLAQVFEGSSSHELMVWSPYLPKDLPAFVQKLKKAVDIEDLRFHLVPDRIQGQYIRTPWTEKLQELVNNEDVIFYDNPSVRHDNVELCHSKIWKLGGKLAIGSWNFTGPGSNLPDEKGRRNERSNIEAGFIVADNHSWNDAVGKPINMNATNFASDDLLKEESLQVPDQLPFDIRVNFDWREQHYDFVGKWYEGMVDESYSVKVPGVSRSIPLSWMSNELSVKPVVLSNTVQLLSEHRFEVLHQDKVVHRALITETGLDFRRSQAFESLSDLLDAFVFGGEPGPGDSIPFRLPISHDSESLENDFVDDAPAGVVLTEGNISFFRLFQAIHQYAQKIEVVMKVDDLNSWVFKRPGCLLELVDKAKVKIETSEPSVFNWFLAQEVKALCMQARKKRELLYNNAEDSVPEARWDELDVPVPVLPKVIQEGYVDMIKKECSYGRV
jgi:hypothetical protein